MNTITDIKKTAHTQPLLYKYISNTGYTAQFVSPEDAMTEQVMNTDLIILDLTHIDLDAGCLIPFILNKHRKSAVVALVNNDENGLYAISEGVQDYLVKGKYNESFIKRVVTAAVKRKKVLDQQEGRKNEYKKFFLESPVPKWIFDLQTFRFLDVNEAAILNYGYSREEFLSMTINDIRPQSEVLALADMIKRNKQDSYYDARYWRHIRKCGTVFFAHVFSHPVSYKGRAAKLVLAIDVDEKVKTDRINKVLNDTAIDEKNRYEEILSSITEVVWSMDADTHELLYMNDVSQKILGYSKDDRIADKNIMIDAIHNEDKEKFAAAMKGLYTSGKMKCEYRYCHKDGTIKRLITTAVLKRDTSWVRNIINGITIDVTRLRTTEYALQEKAAEMTDILEGTPNAFFALDKNWKFTYLNKAAEKLYHVERENVLGVNVWEFFPLVLQETKFYTEFQRVMQERKSVVFEELSPTLGIWISAHMFPIPNGIAGFFIDITEKKKHLLKIEDQNERLREIAWIQSHKVRGPVATMLGLMQLFNYQQPEDEVNKEILEGLRASTTKLDNVIKEVVGISEG